MTIFNVRIDREVLLVFEGIEAESHDAAAAIACDQHPAAADDIDDCDGETFSAIVEVAGDEDLGQSVTIDFEPGRQRKAAPVMLKALQMASNYMADDLDESDETELRVFRSIRAAIAEAEGSGIPSEPAAPTLLAALEALLPYAENERGSLGECWKRDGDTRAKEELDACDRGLDRARDAIARAKGTTPAVDSAATRPARFEIEHNQAENSDRVYVLVDGKFDVAIIRTDEGVVVDVYPKDGFETIATTYASDSDVEPESSTN